MAKVKKLPSKPAESEIVDNLFVISAFPQDQNYSEQYLQRKDVDIYVREVGKGTEPVTVVHSGFGANHD